MEGKEWLHRGMKRKEWLYHGRKLLWALFAGICYLLAAGAFGQTEGGPVWVELSGSLPNRSQGEKIHELEEKQESPLDFTLWEPLGERLVESGGLFKKTRAQILVLCGPSKNLLPGAYGLETEDEEGCLLDEKAAYDLFGSVQAAGGEVRIQGKDYRVRQVASGKQGLVMIQGGEEERFSKLALSLPEKGEGREEFLMRYQLEGRLSDDSLFRAGARVSLLLLPFLLALRGMRILRKGQREADAMSGKFLWGLGLFALAAVFFGGLLQAAEFPRELIPAKWSDFSFWGERIREKGEGLACYLAGSKGPGQLVRQAAFGRSVFFSLGSCLGYGLACRGPLPAGEAASKIPEVRPPVLR